LNLKPLTVLIYALKKKRDFFAGKKESGPTKLWKSREKKELNVRDIEKKIFKFTRQGKWKRQLFTRSLEI
jgi:hypothetical protein